MSSHLHHGKGARLLLVALLMLATALALAAMASADHPADEDANQGGSGLSEFTGDWNVAAGDDLVYANQTISLDGNLSVADGGSLTLRNVTLELHGGESDPQEIGVFDGTLVVTDWDGDPMTEADRSVIKAADPEYNYYFGVFEDATFELTNSLVTDCGRLFNLLGLQAGVYVATEDATIHHTEMAMGYGGLFIDGVDLTVTDLDIHDCEWIGIYVDHTANPEIRDCDIEGNEREGLMVKDQSDVLLVDCSIRDNLRGMVVDGSFVSAYGCAISANDEVDIDLPYFSQVEMFNCTVTASPSTPPVRMENSSLTSTHGNFDVAQVEMTASLFRYQHFLTVAVTWSDSRLTPIPDVPIEVEDAEGNRFFFETGEDGRAADLPMLVVEYDMTGPFLKTTSFNPLKVTVTHNLQDKDTYADMRYDNALVSFQYVDTVPPVAQAPLLSEVDVGINTTLDGSACYDNVAVETWNWSFDELGAKVYLEGETVEYAFKEAKEYTITLKVEDTSGNTDTGSSVKFDVTARDRIPPVADAGPDQDVDQGTVVTLDGSNSTDNVNIVEYVWSFTYDGAPRSLNGRVVTWQFDLPGVYLVVLTVYDAASLSDTVEANVTVQDTMAPVTTVEPNPEMPTGRKYDEIVQFIFTVNDEGGGTVELNYRVNGVEWESVIGSLSLSFGGDLQYPDGTYEIEYYSKDAAGNTEELQTVDSFVVDATDPTFSDMDPPLSPYLTTEETYTITGKTEPGSTLTVNEDTVTVAADGSFTYEAALEMGDNAYYLKAVDQVGHSADLTVIIKREKYETGTNGDDGSNALLYGALAAVVIVVVVLLFFFLVMRKDRGEDL